MKLKALLSAGAIVGGLCFAAPTALAANDCCWDWSPTEPGIDDAGKGGPKDDPDSPWAQCTNTPAANCFLRDGRQMRWINWTCLQGSPAPPPGGIPSNPNAGFLCAEKGPGGPGPQMKLDPNPGAGGPPSVPPLDIEGPSIVIPTMTEWGLIVMGLLLVTGGTIAIRRGRAAAPAMA